MAALFQVGGVTAGSRPRFGRTSLLILLLAVVTVAWWVAVFTRANAYDTPPTDPGTVTICPVDPLMGVYNPSRLIVIKPCQLYKGTVMRVRQRKDGDYHVDVRPHPGFAGMLNDRNYEAQNGWMVVEIMPGQDMPIPAVGQRVAYIGTHVTDLPNPDDPNDHGWNEMHPVFAQWIKDEPLPARHRSVVVAWPVVPPEHEG